jgi:hypothetical protein
MWCPSVTIWRWQLSARITCVPTDWDEKFSSVAVVKTSSKEEAVWGEGIPVAPNGESSAASRLITSSHDRAGGFPARLPLGARGHPFVARLGIRFEGMGPEVVALRYASAYMLGWAFVLGMFAIPRGEGRVVIFGLGAAANGGAEVRAFFNGAFYVWAAYTVPCLLSPVPFGLVAPALYDLVTRIRKT